MCHDCKNDSTFQYDCIIKNAWQPWRHFKSPTNDTSFGLTNDQKKCVINTFLKTGPTRRSRRILPSVCLPSILHSSSMAYFYYKILIQLLESFKFCLLSNSKLHQEHVCHVMHSSDKPCAKETQGNLKWSLMLMSN